MQCWQTLAARAVEIRNELNMKTPSEQIVDPSPGSTHEPAFPFIPVLACGMLPDRAGMPGGNRMGNRIPAVRWGLELFSRCASRLSKGIGVASYKGQVLSRRAGYPARLAV